MNPAPLKLALLAGIALAASVTLYAPTAMAAGQISVDVGEDIGMAPPPPRIERVTSPRVGFVWSPGYWRWHQSTHRHSWVGGQWMPVRPGYRYHPARWVRHGHRWRFHASYWGR